ncbi:MAG: hypoxanthine-guanine phosphoribosyltransferase [Gammaproteobacteria bacterium]|nr:MAG: hypoxanthine-guanine phosphoribosyltransferase [Gammaproteobacteria bacterium]
MSGISAAEAERVLSEADCLHSAADVDAAYDCMAAAITTALGTSDPGVLGVMNGGLIPAGELLRRMSFPLALDYVHATRYRGGVRGHELEWRVKPATDLQARTVLVVDDILDEAITLAAIVKFCRSQGAANVFSAVLVEKCHDRNRSELKVDFCGLQVADRYVFGSGMDYKERLRNVRGIYAVKGL